MTNQKNRQRQQLRDQFFSCSVFQLKATADSSAVLRDDKPEIRAAAGVTAKNQALVAMGDSMRSCFAPADQWPGSMLGKMPSRRSSSARRSLWAMVRVPA